MRKFNLFAIFAFIASALMFSSCGEDDPLGPEFGAGSGVIVDNGVLTTAEVTVGQSVTFTWTVTEGDSKLKELEIRNGVKTIYKTDIVDSVASGKFTYAFTEEGDAQIAIIATDKDDLDDQLDITVKVSGKATSLTESATVTLGAQKASSGSCYDVSAATQYKTSGDEAKNNSEKVDFVYYYGSTNKATICAPIDASVNGDGTGSAFTTCTDWATKNATKFAKATFSYEEATDALVEAATPTATIIKELAVGDVVVFETADSKKGVFSVTAISKSDDTGEISLGIKVK